MALDGFFGCNLHLTADEQARRYGPTLTIRCTWLVGGWAAFENETETEREYEREHGERIGYEIRSTDRGLDMHELPRELGARN